MREAAKQYREGQGALPARPVGAAHREVRQAIKEIPIGRRGVAFDRIDLYAWAYEHKNRNVVPRVNS